MSPGICRLQAPPREHTAIAYSPPLGLQDQAAQRFRVILPLSVMTLDPPSGINSSLFVVLGRRVFACCLRRRFVVWKILQSGKSLELYSNSWTWYGTDFLPLFLLLRNCLGTGLGGQVSSAPWRTYDKSFDSGFAFFQKTVISVS